MEVTKKPSKEELQLVNFLEQLNRKLSIVTDKQKEAREKEDQPGKSLGIEYDIFLVSLD